MARPSTEETGMHRRVTNALPGSQLPEDFVASLTNELGVDADKLVASLSNEEDIERALNAASSSCLVVIEALLEVGGQIEARALQELLLARFNWTASQFETAINEACMLGLSFRGMFSPPYSEALDCVFVLREMSAVMAPKVMGVSLPRVPKSLLTEAVPAHPSSTLLRDRLARTAATLHFPVKAAQGGLNVNRTTIRKLAAATGLSDQALYDELAEAIRNGALDTHRDLVAPSVQRLRALAAHTRQWSSDAAERLLRAWVGESWVSEKALVRALAMSTRVPNRWPIWAAHNAYRSVGVKEFALAQSIVAKTDFLRREHEGETFVHAHVHAEKPGGDGHVTPSLEVMLGPDANLDLTVTIALCAEPVRFDRVLTFKLTPASISAAVSAGVDRTTVLDALARVGRHPLPSNVVAMVEDWMRSARSARIRPAWVIEFSGSEAADVAMKALGANVIARPSPNLLLVDQSLSKPESLLAKHGIRVKDTETQETSTQHADLADMASTLALGLAPSEALRDKVAKATRAGFPTENAPALMRGGAPAPEAPLAPWTTLLERARVADHQAQRGFLEIASRIIFEASPTLGAWITKLAPKDAEEAQRLGAAAPLALLEWASLNAKTQAKLLRAHASLPSLIRAARSAAGPLTLVRDALPLSRLLLHPELAALLEADLRAADLQEFIPAASAKPTRSKPKPAQPPPSEGASMRTQIEAAMNASQVLWMHVSSKTQGDRVVLFKPERITVRGNETLVLGTDVEGDEGRAFPLASVKAVRIRA